MQITTVKISGEGYLVNGAMSVPKAGGNRHYQAVLEWLETNTPDPECTVEELAEQTAVTTKAAKEAQVASLTVTTASGNVFDADRKAREALTTAVAVGSPGMTTPWKLADNTVEVVPYEELKEALLLLGNAHTAILITG